MGSCLLRELGFCPKESLASAFVVTSRSIIQNFTHYGKPCGLVTLYTLTKVYCYPLMFQVASRWVWSDQVHKPWSESHLSMENFTGHSGFTGPKPLKFTEARRHFRAQRGDSVKDRFVELVPGSNGPESVDVLKSTVRSLSWMKVNPRWPSIWSATCAHSGHHRLQIWAYESKMVKSYAQNSER